MGSPFTPSPRSHVVAVPNENPGSELVHLNLVHHQGRLTRWLPGDGIDGLPRTNFRMSEGNDRGFWPQVEEPNMTKIPFGGIFDYEGRPEGVVSDEPEEPADAATPNDYHTFLRNRGLDQTLETGEEPGRK